MTSLAADAAAGKAGDALSSAEEKLEELYFIHDNFFSKSVEEKAGIVELLRTPSGKRSMHRCQCLLPWWCG